MLRRERHAAGLSQQVIAERVRVHQATLARWETGQRAPTLAQIDEVLEVLGLRLRLDVEPTPGPHQEWDREALRLASMTPEERLREVDSSLANLLEKAQSHGVAGYVDGQTAAWLQAVPGPPRRWDVATPPDHVIRWLTLPLAAVGAVDDALMHVRLRKEEAAEQIIADGNGLLTSIFGYINLRVVDEAPPTVRLLLRSAAEEETRVEAEVIRLDALAAHWQQQTP